MTTSREPCTIRDIATVGRLIRELREKSRIEQGDLAKVAEMSRSYISRLENGGILNPKINDLAKVASALGTSVSYLVEAPPETDTLTAALTPQLGLRSAQHLRDVIEEIRQWPEDEQQFIVQLFWNLTHNWPGRPERHMNPTIRRSTIAE
jgi:transcriptional regulator with XRE-family HTH domain